MTHLINLTDEYTTASGKEVRVLCVDAKNWHYPVVALVDGVVEQLTSKGLLQHGTCKTPYLIPKPKMLVRYVNIYPYKEVYGVHLSRSEADACATTTRIACVRIEVLGGQFDE